MLAFVDLCELKTKLDVGSDITKTRRKKIMALGRLFPPLLASEFLTFHVVHNKRAMSNKIVERERERKL
jgi:hypothetical protein